MNARFVGWAVPGWRVYKQDLRKLSFWLQFNQSRGAKGERLLTSLSHGYMVKLVARSGGYLPKMQQQRGGGKSEGVLSLGDHFSDLPEKSVGWQDLHRPTLDENVFVR